MRGRLGLPLQVGVGAGEGPWQFAGGLGEDAADEPLTCLPQSVDEGVLGEEGREGRRGGRGGEGGEEGREGDEGNEGDKDGWSHQLELGLQTDR